jgi:transcription elongation factor Elf1
MQPSYISHYRETKYPCPHCSHPLQESVTYEYDIEKAILWCEHCNAVYDCDDYYSYDIDENYNITKEHHD